MGSLLAIRDFEEAHDHVDQLGNWQGYKYERGFRMGWTLSKIVAYKALVRYQ